jgi:hypothetical protein
MGGHDSARIGKVRFSEAFLKACWVLYLPEIHYTIWDSSRRVPKEPENFKGDVHFYII